MSPKPVKEYDMRLFLKQTLVKEIMSTPVVTLEKDAQFSEVEEKFVDYEIRHLPVVDSEGKLAGIITKRDLYRTLAPRKAIDGNVDYVKDKIIEKDTEVFYFKEMLDSFILEKIMIRNVATLKEDNSVAEVIHLMVEKKIGSVVIVDKYKKIIGIVTRYDILMLANKVVKGNF